ncbi:MULTISPECIES: bifunctional folylpolyglutamate synthase/dihydrofolate synthase [Alteribacter]|uniref:tetrahydrofolate synthase n=1 Tax=Alteribacter keqinensis TaxID=2483800 RepID=A0A3M7TXK1_9BACI|nr:MULTISPECIES: folylpolyglutamate synthase/dihydrofolate synthase family protein [Alteribacter]MBM7096573.1 bifunctional folylpolyglutamate synthase/dihydrofolate synthase [Alteribacter salitolerans]RNA70223.1 bifunctional folylpolyglutamate synthase/dihydrofolate synthase [Alteribacter keqinensis]
MSKINLGLERVELLMEKLRHPERRVKTIHVAGTNGKGSTTAYLREMLKEAGFITGTYTSPYWDTPAEQIAINGEHIRESELEKCLSEIAPAIKETETDLGSVVTEFERMTAAALYYFSTMKPVDIAIIETGMGGRRDATNVIVPLVSIITTVGMDHEAWLGDTIRVISREKAGVIKSGVPVFTAVQGEALDVIKEEARLKHTKVYEAGKAAKITIEERKKDETTFQYSSSYKDLKNLSTLMPGDHQVTNAALGIMAIDYMKQYYAMMVDDEAIRNGIKQAVMPGRLEKVSKNPVVLLDTAHNPQAIEALAKTIKARYQDTDFNVLFGVMKDKDYKQMLQMLRESFSEVLVTSFDDERAASIDQLQLNEITAVDDVRSWLEKNNQPLIITGSQKFIGQVRQYLT